MDVLFVDMILSKIAEIIIFHDSLKHAFIYVGLMFQSNDALLSIQAHQKQMISCTLDCLTIGQENTTAVGIKDNDILSVKHRLSIKENNIQKISQTFMIEKIVVNAYVKKILEIHHKITLLLYIYAFF